MTVLTPSENAPIKMHGIAEPAPRTQPRGQLGLAAALIAIHGMLAWTIRSFAVSSHDQANYILLARSLRHFRYVDAFLVGTPRHTLYPPAYPSFLALLSLPFGEHLNLIIAANVAASMATLGLLYDVMRRRIGNAVALAGLALGVLNPFVAQFAGTPLSETPYTLLSTIALWAILREPPAARAARPRAWLWPALAGSAATCAALTRSAGVTVLGAVFVYWLLERQYRRAWLLFVAGLLTVGSWFVWIAFGVAKAATKSYASDILFTPSPNVGLLRAVGGRVLQNVVDYPAKNFPTVLPEPTLAGTTVDNIVGLVVILVLAAAGVIVCWKRARALLVYLATYAAMLAAWRWNEHRLLVPILPLLLYLITAGASRLAEVWRLLRPTPLLIVGIIGSTAAFQDWTAVQAALRCDRAHATTSEACFPIERLGFFAAMRFVREATPPAAVILTADDALTGYYGDRQTVDVRRFSGGDSTLVASWRALGVRYVLLSPQRSPLALRLPLWVERCADLAPVKEFPATTLLLYLPPAGALPPAPNACADIQRYSQSAINHALWPEPVGVAPP